MQSFHHRKVGLGVWRLSCIILLFLSSVCDELHAAESDAPTSGQIEFFEKQVRPIFIEHCVGCHGIRKQESGLRLDSREGFLRGGETFGALISSQDLSKSPLLDVLSYQSEIQMPPDKMLSEDTIAVLAKWLNLGAPWPTEIMPTEPTFDIREAWAEHWATQPIRTPVVPQDDDLNLVRSPVDAFVRRRMKADGLYPSEVADPRTLIRRASYDLIGLPPTYTEVQEFEQELKLNPQSAFRNLIERLLDSPHYGERWARHWLDVARYADTKGYVRLQEQPNYYYAYIYRDYVVRAFNEDLPFDQFVLEQLAADKIQVGPDNRRLAALGFLTLGRRFTSNKHDIIDDRIDVVSRGLLGLTVTCARCHDHKYDPIPTEDYYSFYGVFASTREPSEPILLHSGGDAPVYHGEMSEYLEKRKPLDELISKEHPKLLDMLRADSVRYLQAAVGGRKPFLVPLPAAQGELRQTFVERWIEYIEGTSGGHHRVFGPWHALANLETENFTVDARRVLDQLFAEEDPGQSNRRILNALSAQDLASMEAVAVVYGKTFCRIHDLWKVKITETPTRTVFSDPGDEELRQVLYGVDSPFQMTPRDAIDDYLYDFDINKEIAQAYLDFDAWLISTEHAPQRAHVLLDASRPTEPRIFVRGNPERPGALVRRHFLSALDEHQAPASFLNGSGRLELAQAIISPDNPLTARVIVNRVWLHHFGVGLVATPSNFGLRAEPPSHPELLDYLAREFIDSGWSIKRLHRTIMNSATYQQSSRIKRSAGRHEKVGAVGDAPIEEVNRVAKDPANRWLWRMNRRRLDFESLRDSMLLVAGRLDLSVGGRSIDFEDPKNVRRTLYGTIKRSSMPEIFEVFDFPSPDTHNAARSQTTVPQQALYLMNNPFVLEQADHLAAVVRDQEMVSTESRVKHLYKLVLAREPREKEIERTMRYVANKGSWSQLAQMLMVSNEFLFVD